MLAPAEHLHTKCLRTSAGLRLRQGDSSFGLWSVFTQTGRSWGEEIMLNSNYHFHSIVFPLNVHILFTEPQIISIRRDFWRPLVQLLLQAMPITPGYAGPIYSQISSIFPKNKPWSLRLSHTWRSLAPGPPRFGIIQQLVQSALGPIVLATDNNIAQYFFQFWSLREDLSRRPPAGHPATLQTQRHLQLSTNHPPLTSLAIRIL